MNEKAARESAVIWRTRKVWWEARRHRETGETVEDDHACVMINIKRDSNKRRKTATEGSFKVYKLRATHKEHKETARRFREAMIEAATQKQEQGRKRNRYDSIIEAFHVGGHKVLGKHGGGDRRKQESEKSKAAEQGTEEEKKGEEGKKARENSGQREERKGGNKERHGKDVQTTKTGEHGRPRTNETDGERSDEGNKTTPNETGKHAIDTAIQE